MAKKMVSVSAVELRKLKARVKAEEKKKEKKAARKIDGLGPHLKSKIRSALREVWHRSEARKLVVARVALPNGFSRCEDPKCKNKKYPKVYIDHTVNVGDVDQGFIDRMFVPSTELKALCKVHHDAKTKAERSASKNKTRKDENEDFY